MLDSFGFELSQSIALQSSYHSLLQPAQLTCTYLRRQFGWATQCKSSSIRVLSASRAAIKPVQQLTAFRKMVISVLKQAPSALSAVQKAQTDAKFDWHQTGDSDARTRRAKQFGFKGVNSSIINSECIGYL